MPSDPGKTNAKGKSASRRQQTQAPRVDIPEALSYDDILLVPVRTGIKSRRQVDTSALLTRNLAVRIPVVSANMDTVTESYMATEMARQGGIGIIHRFLTIEAEAAEVRKVKRAESFVISQPYTISPDQTVEQARTLMDGRDVERPRGH